MNNNKIIKIVTNKQIINKYLEIPTFSMRLERHFYISKLCKKFKKRFASLP